MNRTIYPSKQSGFQPSRIYWSNESVQRWHLEDTLEEDNSPEHPATRASAQREQPRSSKWRITVLFMHLSQPCTRRPQPGNSSSMCVFFQKKLGLLAWPTLGYFPVALPHLIVLWIKQLSTDCPKCESCPLKRKEQKKKQLWVCVWCSRFLVIHCHLTESNCGFDQLCFFLS